MSIPTAAEAQNDLNQARSDAQTAQQRANDAKKAADDAQQAAEQARGKANDAQKAAQDADQAATEAAQKAANNPQDPAAQQAAQQAQADAATAHETATNAGTAADTAEDDANNAATASDTAQRESERAAAAQQAAQKRSDAAAAAQSSQAELAKADGDLKAAQMSPDLQAQAKYQQELERLLKEANQGSKDAVEADHKTNGFMLHTLVDVSWKVDGCSWNIINGDHWKTGGSEVKIVLGHSTNIHLAPKHESNYGGKYTRIAGTEMKTVAGAAITNIAGAKWDTVYGSKTERCLGAKFETHVGTKTVVKKAKFKDVQPFRFEKGAKSFADSIEMEWKSADNKLDVKQQELKVLQEQSTMGKCTETVTNLNGDYDKVDHNFSSTIKLKLTTGTIKTQDLEIKGSSNVIVSSKGNKLGLTSGAAKMWRGGNVAKCTDGTVKLNGDTFKAE
ncbi:MAG TPA: hypothetical protein VE981_20560 [Planctomycetota bacterium]|nr:hypothetical protein [Planctomycetota bacterium]